MHSAGKKYALCKAVILALPKRSTNKHKRMVFSLVQYIHADKVSTEHMSPYAGITQSDTLMSQGFCCIQILDLRRARLQACLCYTQTPLQYEKVLPLQMHAAKRGVCPVVHLRFSEVFPKCCLLKGQDEERFAHPGLSIGND